MEFRLLTDAMRTQFETDGFLVVRNALNAAEIEALIAAGDRLIATDRTVNRARHEGTAKTDGFRNCIALDDAFLPLLTHQNTVPLIAQLLSANIQLITSHLIYKYPNPPGTPATVRDPRWHRDVMHMPDDLGHANVPRIEIKCAYYLTDLSEPNSGVTLMARGSHRLKTPLDIPAGRVDPLSAVETAVRPGDAILFENRTWHAGGANLSGRIRKTVMFGYGYKWMRPMDYSVQPRELLNKFHDDISLQLLDGLEAPGGEFVPGGISDPLRNWLKHHNATQPLKELAPAPML